jgi:hypothetical protein
LTNTFLYATDSLFLSNPLLYAPISHFLYVGGILPFRFPSSNPSIFKFTFLSFMLQRNIRLYPSFPIPPSCHLFIHSFIHSCFPSFLVSLLCLFAVVFEGYCCTRSHLIKHTYTHTHTRCDFSGRGIGMSQTSLPKNTQHSQETDNHAPGGFRTRNGQRPTP